MKLCWYTDSIDNEVSTVTPRACFSQDIDNRQFVIDYVPGYSDSLFICTGGSWVLELPIDTKYRLTLLFQRTRIQIPSNTGQSTLCYSYDQRYHIKEECTDLFLVCQKPTRAGSRSIHAPLEVANCRGGEAVQWPGGGRSWPPWDVKAEISKAYVHFPLIPFETWYW